MTLLPFKANSKTFDRQRKAREQERDRLIRKIGIRHEDAELFEEELRMWAYEESKRNG